MNGFYATAFPYQFIFLLRSWIEIMTIFVYNFIWFMWKIHSNHCIQTTFAKVCNWLPFIAYLPFREYFCYSNSLIAVYRETHTAHCWFELMMSSLHKLLMSNCCLDLWDFFWMWCKKHIFAWWFRSGVLQAF